MLHNRVLAGVCALAVAALAGCGQSGEPEGGTLRGSYTAFPDALDPALALTTEAGGAMQNTYLPLLTYAHANGEAGTHLVPALAEDMPRIGEGGRRYELTLRPGLRYSDGTPVKASDFKASIERLFLLHSPGSPLFTDIVGAERFARTLEGGISGIETDDARRTITIRLVRPQGFFPYELAVLYSAVLPATTPDENQTSNPPPATGPYMFDSVKRGRSFSLRRNPAWASHNSEAMPDLPSGHMDRIEVKVIANVSTQVNEVESGRLEWMRGPPPPDRLPELRRRYLGTQFRPEPTISTFYFWMNTRKAPFDDVRVRRAVNYAVDPAALERIYAGTMEATQQVLPTEMPGYRHFVLYPHDLGKAKALVAEADPDDREVTVWTNGYGPNEEAGEYYEEVLRAIGLRPKLKVIGLTDFFTIISNTKVKDLDTGWSNWLLDYPHPNDYFQPQLSGESIVPEGNTNWAQFSDPAINHEISRLAEQDLGPEQEAAYAELDREVMRQAPWAPFGSYTGTTFVSSAIDLDEVVFSPMFGQDLTSFRFK